MSLQGTLAVLNQMGRTLTFFDLTSFEKRFVLKDLIAEPHELCYDAKRRLLYISHTYDFGHYYHHGDYGKKVSIFDVEKKEITGYIDVSPGGGPHGLWIYNDVLYVSVEDGLEGGGGLVLVDLESQKVIKSITGGGARCHWVVVTRDGKKGYTINKTGKIVHVLDIEKGTIAKTLDVVGSEEGHVSTDGKHVYLPTQAIQLAPSSEVSGSGFNVIDAVTDEVVRTVSTELPVASIYSIGNNKIMVVQCRFDAGGTFANVTPRPGRLSLFDAETFKLLGEAEVGLQPLTIRCDSDGKLGFAANMLSGTVTVVDLGEMKVVRELDVRENGGAEVKFTQGSQAHGLAIIT